MCEIWFLTHNKDEQHRGLICKILHLCCPVQTMSRAYLKNMANKHKHCYVALDNHNPHFYLHCCLTPRCYPSPRSSFLSLSAVSFHPSTWDLPGSGSILYIQMVLTTAINQKEMGISMDEFPESEPACYSGVVLDDTRPPCTSKEAVAWY